MMCYRQTEGTKPNRPPIRLVAAKKCALGQPEPEAARPSEASGVWGDDHMATLEENDLRLILGDRYDAVTAAQKLVDDKPKPFRAFLKKIFSK